MLPDGVNVVGVVGELEPRHLECSSVRRFLLVSSDSCCIDDGVFSTLMQFFCVYTKLPASKSISAESLQPPPPYA